MVDFGEVNHLVDIVNDGHADAVAFADTLHYERMTLNDIRQNALKAGLSVRKIIKDAV